jgi:2-iminobutanoate/2-iminopropanoate deaminase
MSGVTARGFGGKPAGGDNMKAQSLAIFDRIAALTMAAGGGLQCVYKLVIYVSDMSRKDEVNAARAETFRAAWPCSTLVEVKGFAFEGLLVEVDAFANLDVDMYELG